MFGITAVRSIAPAPSQIDRNQPLPDGLETYLEQGLSLLRSNQPVEFPLDSKNNATEARGVAGSIESWYRDNGISAVSVRVFENVKGDTIRVYPRNKVNRGSKG